MLISCVEHSEVKGERDRLAKDLKTAKRLLRRIIANLYKDHEMRLYDAVLDAKAFLNEKDAPKG